MVSVIGIIGTFPIVIVFGICFGLTLNSYLKNPNRTKIFFMISFFSIALIYCIWGLRVLFIPQFESDTKVLYPIWALIYAIGGLALISLDFATLDLTKMKESNFLKFIKIVILVSYIGGLVLLIIGFDVELLIFMDVTDLTIKNPFIYFYVTTIILLYIFFPNFIFIIYLIKSPSKTEFSYKRLRIIEIGILLWTICIALDGIKFPSNIGILIIRILLMIGGLITMKGFLMKPEQK